MQKTIKEWLETLPEPYRSKALKNLPEYHLDSDVTYANLHDALNAAYTWDATEERHDYCSNVARGLHPFSDEPFNLEAPAEEPALDWPVDAEEPDEPAVYAVLPQDDLPEPPIPEFKSNWTAPQPVSDFPTEGPSETYATDGTVVFEKPHQEPFIQVEGHLMTEGVLKHLSEGLNQEEAIEADALDRTFEKIRQRLDNDNVNHPPHYTQGKVECIDALEAATANLRGIEAVCTANAIKYLWRWKQKNGVEDLKKAKFYIDKLIGDDSQKA
jgi:hypothetical protein